MRFAQRNIVGNHVAVVSRGRGGSAIRILDHAANSDSPENDMNINDALHKLDTLIALLGGKTGRVRTTPMPGDMTPTRDSRELTLEEMRDVVEEQDRQNSFAYGEACNQVGRQLRAGVAPNDCRPGLRRRATDAEDEHAWADAINRRGRELRERK
jgi:hypothetical protein